MIGASPRQREDALPPSDQHDPDPRPMRTVDILGLAELGVLDGRDVGRALELAGCAPTPAGWRSAVDRLLLGLGGALLASGAICIVAYNWSSLSRWGRFGLAQAILLLVFALALRLGLATRYGKAALTLAIALIGPLLALYGQTYQTGADLSGLFLAWAALALPWTLAARAASAWLLWLAILEVGVLLHLTAFDLWEVFWLGVVPTWGWVCFFNLLALLAWEALAERIEWLRGRLAPRVIAACLIGPLTALTCAVILSVRSPGLGLAPVAWLLALAGGYVAYRLRRVDLAMLALGWLAVTIVLLAALGRFLSWGSAGAGAWLLGAALLIASSSLGRQWLRNVHAGAGAAGGVR